MEKKELLRRIPKVDEILQSELLTEVDFPRHMLAEAVREHLDAMRLRILNGETEELAEKETLIAEIARSVLQGAKPSMRTVINATGVTLHTNLGRACISERAAQAAYAAATRYSTLEYNLEAGQRGSRHNHVSKLLCQLTGAEDAMVVNNNAAAVLLILSAMGKNGEVITSRGELVEIGGSFRIPDIMEQCGCRLKEVGATNKTHLHDYEDAISEETCALLKVHTSNYRIMGFSESVSLADLVELGRKHGLPVIEDLGSGCLMDFKQYGIYGEPTVMESVRAGVDVISFSGDKLLGGPQAGLIVGKKEWIEKLKKHQLARAVRVDKMTLAALEATLSSYMDPERALQEIPTVRMLLSDPEQLRCRAEILQGKLAGAGLICEVIPEKDQVGGGSIPTKLLDTYAVAVTPQHCSVDELECRLRHCDTPIVGRITKERYLLGVRTLWDEDFDLIQKEMAEADK